jgi:hypothetical protein
MWDGKRCLLIETMQGCGVDPMTCATAPADWVSAGMSTCADYGNNNYCTHEGGYGAGWQPTFASFDIWSRNGVTALQACCACGGGVASFFPDYVPPVDDTCDDKPGWVSSANTTCNDFVAAGLCASGGYGPNWNISLPGRTWDDLANNETGFTANDACCACGGGVQQCKDSVGWSSPLGDCEAFEVNAWCQADGDNYGPNWSADFGTFDSTQAMGLDGTQAREACCACGGGTAFMAAQQAAVAQAVNSAIALGPEEAAAAAAAASAAAAMGQDPVAAAIAASSGGGSLIPEGMRADSGRVRFSLGVSGVDYLNATMVDPVTDKIKDTVANISGGIESDAVDVVLSAHNTVYVTVTPPEELDVVSVRDNLVGNQTALEDKIKKDVKAIPDYNTHKQGELKVANMTDPVIEAVYYGENAGAHLDSE